MKDRTLPSDFIVQGVMCPPRLCRMVDPYIARIVDEAKANGIAIDPEFLLWGRAVHLEGLRWATIANVSKSDVSADELPQSTHHEQLTTADVAKELGCKPPNVRFHVSEGHLMPARRRPMLFDRAEVDRFKAERRKSA